VRVDFSGEEDAFLNVFEEARNDDPSLDMLKRRRRITITASPEGNGWQATCIYTPQGELLASSRVFLGFVEEGEVGRTQSGPRTVFAQPGGLMLIDGFYRGLRPNLKSLTS
jgi:hypothetical protein